MNEEALAQAYEARKPQLKALGEWVVATVCDELADSLGSAVAVEKFLQIPPKPRVKATDSFLEKALIRKPKDDPLDELTDQVGVRFVVLLLEDIKRIGKIIETDKWDWQKDRDHEAERLAKPDYFAYQSDHYIVRTKSDATFAGIDIPAGLPCEIQIRTILQHAYAEMAHGADYKPSIRLPETDQRHVKRSLAKGSALIETTDDVFKEIQARLEAYDAETRLLLQEAQTIYEEFIGERVAPATALAQVLTDKYRPLLKAANPTEIRKWATEHRWLADTIRKKRIKSVFYRDSVIILIAWLIERHEMTIPKEWPIDSKYLEGLYLDLGISTNGLF